MTKTRNEENDGCIYITKKMVSEFGATLGCKSCLERTDGLGGVSGRITHAWRTILHTRNVSKII